MTRRNRLLSGLLALACVAMPRLATAQNPQPHPTVAPPNAPNPPPEQIAPADRGANGNTTLSEKLSQQQGTLKPPTVDPGIHAPVPAPMQGTMPVIPPPGTPGGDQRVVPK